MALINTLEEVRNIVTIVKGTAFENFKEDFQVVEESEILRYLGQAQYDALITAYGDGSAPIADPNLANLLTHCQRVIVFLGLGSNVDFIDVQIGDNGIQRVEDAENKTAYHYQKLDLQNYCFRMGYSALENLLGFLEANIATFTDWKNSAAYTINRNLYISSATEFHQYYNINNSRRLYQNVQPIIKRIQDFQIDESIGEDLATEIKNQLKDPDTPVSTDNLKLLEDYIRPALAFLTIAEAVYELPMEMTDTGLQLKTQTAGQGNIEKKPAGMDLVGQQATNAEGIGSAYLTKLIKYLNQNASETKYTAFYNSDLYIGTETPKPNPDGKIYNAL